MRAEGTRLARRPLVALVLAATTVGTAAAQEPVYVRRLVLPVAEDQIGYPPGVTADPHTGEIFVCDARMNRVLVFDSDGLFIYEMPGGDAFTGPQDVAIDPEGRLVLVASYDRRPAVVELDFDGLFLREIRLSRLPEGAAEPHVGSRKGWEPGLLLFPAGIARLPGGLVVVADEGNGRAQLFRRSAPGTSP